MIDIEGFVGKLRADFDHLRVKVEKRPYFVGPCDAGWPGGVGAPLTSTSWDGDAYSTTAKTLIDLSAVFGVPAGAKAVEVEISVRDSASLNDASLFFTLAPNDTAGSGTPYLSLPSTTPNDEWVRGKGKVPCDANGDVYYQIAASGEGTMDVYLFVWGYWI